MVFALVIVVSYTRFTEELHLWPQQLSPITMLTP